MKPGHGEVLIAEGDVELAEDELRLVEEFRRQLDEGYIGVVSNGPGRATQVRELPADVPAVILRRPIAGG